MSYTAAVITISDKGALGLRADESGPKIEGLATDAGFKVVHKCIIPDDFDTIVTKLMDCCDNKKISLILTTGGTGFSSRDVTPEATLKVIKREARGIPEAMRFQSLKITNRACLSRAVAGIRGRSLIVNLPGSPKAATENLLAVIDSLKHGLDMLNSNGSADCANNS